MKVYILFLSLSGCAFAVAYPSLTELNESCTSFGVTKPSKDDYLDIIYCYALYYYTRKRKSDNCNGTLTGPSFCFQCITQYVPRRYFSINDNLRNIPINSINVLVKVLMGDASDYFAVKRVIEMFGTKGYDIGTIIFICQNTNCHTIDDINVPTGEEKFERIRTSTIDFSTCIKHIIPEGDEAVSIALKIDHLSKQEGHTICTCGDGFLLYYYSEHRKNVKFQDLFTTVCNVKQLTELNRRVRWWNSKQLYNPEIYKLDEHQISALLVHGSALRDILGTYKEWTLKKIIFHALYFETELDTMDKAFSFCAEFIKSGFTPEQISTLRNETNNAKDMLNIINQKIKN